MNILIVARGYPSERYPMNGIFEWDQAKALAALGHKVVYAAVDLRSLRRRRHWGYESFQRDGVQVRAVNVPVGAVPKTVLQGAGRIALRRLYARLQKELGAPDVVHAHFLESAASAAVLCQYEQLPLVITEHTSSMNVPQLPAAVLACAKQTYAQADICLAVSSVFCRNLSAATGFPFQVVENIVDTGAFCQLPSSQRKDAEFRFVAAGGLSHRKGYDLLLSSFAEVVRENPQCTLTVFGGGEEANRLLQQAADLEISEKVRFRGLRNRMEIAREYRNSDAFVLPSRLETFGVVYIEAMAAGLPVIATRCGGPEDFVTPETGILIDVDDGAALTAAMKRMITVRSQYDSAKISSYAQQRFSPERVAAHLTEIYQQAIALHKT